MIKTRQLLLLLLFPLALSAQPGSKIRKGEKAGQLLTDSSVEKMRQQTDSLAQAIPKIDSQSPNYTIKFDPAPILELQREQRARQKQQAILRIALGLGFAAILVVGLLRNRKRKNSTTGSA